MAIRAVLALLLACSLSIGARARDTRDPENYLFASGRELASLGKLLEREDIRGVQVVYTWRALAPTRDHYDFSRIEADLAFVSRLRKGLFLQIQDRFFERAAREMPAYLLEDP